MEVVEHQHERPWLGKVLEEGAHRAVGAVALLLERDFSSVSESRQRREDVGELCLSVVVEGRELLRVEALDVLVQGIHKDREWQVALEL